MEHRHLFLDLHDLTRVERLHRRLHQPQRLLAAVVVAAVGEEGAREAEVDQLEDAATNDGILRVCACVCV